MDAGTLGIVAATFQSPDEVTKLGTRGSTKDGRRPRGWLEWSDVSFEVRSGHPVEMGIDGESAVLDPPIRFRTLPGALRVRIPSHAPGYSPAAAAQTAGWSAITALLQTAAGRPMTADA